MSSLATVFPSEGSANNSTEVEWRRRGSGPENSLKRQSHTGADKLKGWRPGDVWRGTGCDIASYPGSFSPLQRKSLGTRLVVTMISSIAAVHSTFYKPVNDFAVVLPRGRPAGPLLG